MPDSFNEYLLDVYLERGIEMARIEAGLQDDVRAILEDLANELSKTLAGVNWATGTVDQNLIRLNKLQKEVDALISDSYTQIGDSTKKSMVQLSSAEVVWFERVINTYLGINLFDTSLSASLLKALANKAIIQGAPAMAWWAKQEEATLFEFMREMRLGILQGETLNELVRRVRGRRENRFEDGVISASTRNAEALVRTSSQSVMNSVRSELYGNNRDLIKGLQWHTALDYRVCPQCRPRDGAVWDMDEEPLNDAAKEFAFVTPPIHFNDRCVIVPVLYSFTELAEKFGGDTELGALLDSLSPSTRSSINGQVPATMTFDKWLKSRDAVDPQAVEDMLGPARYKLWKSGRLSLAGFLDDRGRPMRIDQLT